MTVKVFQTNKEGKETVSYTFDEPESDFAKEIADFIFDYGKLKAKWNAKKTRICNGAMKGKWYFIASNGQHWTNDVANRFKELGFSLKYNEKSGPTELLEMMQDIETFTKKHV
jgi:hypothetical protein